MFSVRQSKDQVLDELYPVDWLRRLLGEQFVLRIVAPEGEPNGLDLYVDRAPEGYSGIVLESVDDAVTIRTVARLEPADEESFSIDIILEKGDSPSASRPHVRISRDMIRILRERQERQIDRAFQEMVERIDETN